MFRAAMEQAMAATGIASMAGSTPSSAGASGMSTGAAASRQQSTQDDDLMKKNLDQ